MQKDMYAYRLQTMKHLFNNHSLFINLSIYLLARYKLLYDPAQQSVLCSSLKRSLDLWSHLTLQVS